MAKDQLANCSGAEFVAPHRQVHPPRNRCHLELLPSGARQPRTHSASQVLSSGETRPHFSRALELLLRPNRRPSCVSFHAAYRTDRSSSGTKTIVLNVPPSPTVEESTVKLTERTDASSGITVQNRYLVPSSLRRARVRRVRLSLIFDKTADDSRNCSLIDEVFGNGASDSSSNLSHRPSAAASTMSSKRAASRALGDGSLSIILRIPRIRRREFKVHGSTSSMVCQSFILKAGANHVARSDTQRICLS
jgi:hypothetical protein